MGKKNKLTTHQLKNLKSASEMMTEQEEKMFYSSKRHTSEESAHHNFKRSNNSRTDMEEEDDENIAQIEISNLNQTSAEEVTEFINKLIAKNKISCKNAFDVPLIHLEQMEDFRASLNENTWKRLSSTLENDYKIYGYRVDATHTITYKMVESIARHQATAEETMTQNMEIFPKSAQAKTLLHQDSFLDSFMEVEYNENVQKNKLNVDYTKFVQKNHKMLNVNHIESFFGYNPGLERTKRKFDQQGFKSLLLNNICLQNGCELKLDEHNHHQDKEEEGKLKKEMEDQDPLEDIKQMDENRFEELLNKVFYQNENSIMTENEENQKGIFSQIHELNVNDAKVRNDNFTDFERLYKIVSGEDKLKPNKRIKENMQLIMQQNMNLEAQNLEAVQNEQIIDKVENQNESMMVKQQYSVQPNEEADQNKNDPINEENPQNLLQKSNHLQQEYIPQPRPYESLPISNHIQSSNLSLTQPKEEPEHILINQNFEMKEVNLENLDQESQSNHSSQTQKPDAAGRLRNIEEYIKLKEPRKKDKKVKLNIEDLSSEEIGKRLFNRKYAKKKGQNSKPDDSVKQENGTPNKKINFTQLHKQANDLKRSVIFKKSAAQDRVFCQTKQRIKQKFKEREKNKTVSKEADKQKKKNGKKISRLFDLPVYQFEQADINFINPIEEIDPETSQLQFSELYKRHFPSFVFSSNQILEEIRRKKELKNKLLLESQHQQRLQQGNMMETIEEEQNSLNGNQDKRIEEQNMLGISGDSPDISFIQGDISQIKGNQVVIREAKEKVKKLMLKMFKDIKKKKSNSQTKRKPCKISFKKIYEAYYHQNGYISPALCFLTILHLTNEHDLILDGKEDGSNFKIFLDNENKIQKDLEIQEENNETKVEIEGSFFSREDSSISSFKTENSKILRDISRNDHN